MERNKYIRHALMSRVCLDGQASFMDSAGSALTSENSKQSHGDLNGILRLSLFCWHVPERGWALHAGPLWVMG